MTNLLHGHLGMAGDGDARRPQVQYDVFLGRADGDRCGQAGYGGRDIEGSFKPFNGGHQERSIMLHRQENVVFLITAFAPMPPASDLQKTSRARITRRPLAAECCEQLACAPTFQRATKYLRTRHDRKQDTPSGTAANATTNQKNATTTLRMRIMCL